MQIEKNESGIRVKRELEAGFFQFVDMPLPAVLTIESGISPSTPREFRFADFTLCSG